MAEEELDKLKEILVNYREIQSSQSKYLFHHNKNDQKQNQFYLSPCRRFVYGKIQKVELSIKTSQLVHLPCNVMADDMEKLPFIPYDSGNKQAFIPSGIKDSSCSTPMSQRAKKTIENDQLKFLIILKVLKLYPERKWMLSLWLIFQLLKKEEPKYNEVIGLIQRVTGNKTNKNSNEYKEIYPRYCKLCNLYNCLSHFQDNSQAEEENENGISSDSDEIKECNPGSPEIARNVKRPMQKLDPSLRMSKLYIHEHHLDETGLWAKSYSCKNTKKCARFNENIFTSKDPELVKFFLNKSMNNPCFISFFLNIQCRKIGYLISKHSFEHYKTPGLLPKIPSFEYSSTKYKKKFMSITTHICECKICDENCGCLIGAERKGILYPNKICDRYCECPVSCAQRFLGCSCQYGRCDSNLCICFANDRECDPILCRNCCSFLSVARTIKNVKMSGLLCKNLASQKTKTKKPMVALSLSTLKGAGTGCFSMNKMKANEFIGEYTGELLSKRELEMRAAVYDFLSHSFVFNLQKEPVLDIDSTYFGNLMRYINHQSHDLENCEIRSSYVNGNIKKLVFTRKKIKPESEIFLNYNYNSYVEFKWYRNYESQF